MVSIISYKSILLTYFSIIIEETANELFRTAYLLLYISSPILFNENMDFSIVLLLSAIFWCPFYCPWEAFRIRRDVPVEFPVEIWGLNLELVNSDDGAQFRKIDPLSVVSAVFIDLNALLSTRRHN